MRRSVACAAFVVAIGVSARAQDTTTATPKHFLRVVYVYDSLTQEPIVGAEIKDLLTGNSLETTRTGNAELVPEFVKSTGAMLSVRKLGYAPVSLFVDPLVPTAFGVALSPAVVELPTVVTRANFQMARDVGTRAGFDRRCASGQPTCFRGDSIAQYPSHGLGDFIRFAPGVHNKLGTMWSTGANMCTPTFYVDGGLWKSPPLPNPLLGPLDVQPHGQFTEPSPFTPLNVQGIEVYPSGQPRPPRFGGGDPSCGAIVIWTKDDER
jgi:hypothetical protein